MTPRRIGVAVLVLAALGLFWTNRSSDRKEIERQLDELTERVSRDGAETQLAGLNQARLITELFASSFEVRAEQLRFSTRDRREMAGFIHGYRRGSDRISLRASNKTLDIDEASRRATHRVDFQFTGGGPMGSPSERYRVQINWLEEEGEWRIDYVDLIEILEGGNPLGF
jgi:hypothetical protein